MSDDPDQIHPEQPDEPSDRLRRLLSANEEPEETMRPAAKPEQVPAEPENAVPQEPAEDEEQPSEMGGETTQSLSRHPTGDPDATGGWYGQDLEGDSTGSVARHPTGVPDQTGGWYAEEDASQPGDQAGETRPIATQPYDETTRPVLPSRDPVHPRPVPQRPAQEYSGLPGEPLPNRVDEVDPYATRVTPAAYGANRPAPSRAVTQTARPMPGAPPRRPGSLPIRPQTPPPSAPPARRGISWGCIGRGLIGMIFAGVILLLGVVSIGVVQYYSIRSELPSVADLRERASQFETTRILDRNGNVIYEIIDPNAGRRTYIPIERISPSLIAATIATEDKDFYNHPGFDPVAIARAFWQNYTAGETVSGASTITQQLARMLLLTPEERFERSNRRKIREIVLAAEITRQYSKEEILELFLNENNYGKMAYGIEAAAETYFSTTADKLTFGQSAFLAGLPQAPSIYDIESNRPATIERFRQVLVLTYQLSQENGCIYVSNSAERVCVDEALLAQAVEEIGAYTYQGPQDVIRFPHWVDYIRTQLESAFDPQTIYRSGFTVFTTLDPALQEQAQAIVTNQVQSLADRNVSSGALVAIRPSTGEILAMVGSADFYNDAISGQVNMTVQPRQPGSTMKPLTYVAAFERGWTPSTLIWDVPSEFPPSGDPNDPREPYVPVNYDGQFHGPVRLREALANSYNIPAVKALQFVGIYDNPNTGQADGLVPMAQRLGITTLTRPDYGLSLTLGGGDVTLLQMTSAFGAFGNNGRRVPPVAITRIVDHEGNLVFDYQVPPGDQVIRPEHAYLISSILSDNEARTPAFGANSILNLPFAAAVKTGTTNDFRDNWTVGYTPDLAVGVWVGNADYTPMNGTSGLTGAAPIWSEFMQYSIGQLLGGSPSPFARPAGVVERIICETSGTEPSEWCPEQRLELFAYDQLPPAKEEDLWQRVTLDTWTGLKASAACSNYTDERFVINVTDTTARRWLTETEPGRAWATSMGIDDPISFVPERECRLEDQRPTIMLANLQNGETIQESPLDIYAVVNAPVDFRRWRLDYGLGNEPQEWVQLVDWTDRQYTNPEMIHAWEVAGLPAGTVSLRLHMQSTRDTYAEQIVRINLQVPTPTATQTTTATITPSPTMTLTLAPLPTITNTPLPSVTPTPTEEP